MDPMFDWIWQGQRRSSIVRLNVPTHAAANTPVIILLHGTSGNINDMAHPAVHPGLNHERVPAGAVRDRGWHSYPNAGWWSVGIDELAPVEGWESFLNRGQFATVNYSQAAPRGSLAESAAELRALLHQLGSSQAFAPVAFRPIVLLGHSRGGVLARQVIVDLLAAGSPVLHRIEKCITLHAPNQGSMLADVAIALDAQAVMWRGIIDDPTIDGLLAMIHEEAGSTAYHDYAVGATTLRLIAAAEPISKIQYFTFGGTRSVLFNLAGWAFTAESAWPQPHSPSFHWTTVYQPFLEIPGNVPGFLELANGFGDVLVAASRARLPFSVHRDNYLNHAECLWDPALQRQVAAVLLGTHLEDDGLEEASEEAPPRTSHEPSPTVEVTSPRLKDHSLENVNHDGCCDFYHGPPWWVTLPPWFPVDARAPSHTGPLTSRARG